MDIVIIASVATVGFGVVFVVIALVFVVVVVVRPL